MTNSKYVFRVRKRDNLQTIQVVERLKKNFFFFHFFTRKISFFLARFVLNFRQQQKIKCVCLRVCVLFFKSVPTTPIIIIIIVHCHNIFYVVIVKYYYYYYYNNCCLCRRGTFAFSLTLRQTTTKILFLHPTFVSFFLVFFFYFIFFLEFLVSLLSPLRRKKERKILDHSKATIYLLDKKQNEKSLKKFL